MPQISAAIRRGLIEAQQVSSGRRYGPGFPRPFAAASLKRVDGGLLRGGGVQISAAIRRGLIEASFQPQPSVRY